MVKISQLNSTGILSHNFFIYSNFNFTKPSAGCTRMLYYARALADDNHKVFLTTCNRSSLQDDCFKEIHPNIFVHQVKKDSVNFFATITYLFNLRSFAKTKGPRRSFIFYPSPLVFLEVLAIIYLKLLKKECLYYELNEIRKYTSSFIDPLTIYKPAYSIKKIIYKIVFYLIEPLLRFYDGLICISTAIEKYGKKFNANTIRIPILTDPSLKISPRKEKYFTRGSFNIGFSGTISSNKENLDEFIHALIRLVEGGYDITFNLCGNISKNDYHRLIAKNENKINIIYHGRLNQVELSSFLSSQDLLVIPRGFTLQNKFGFSTKLSDYLNHRKVILVTDVSDNKLFIEDGISGFVVQPNNLEEMYDKLVFILENYDHIKNSMIEKAGIVSENKFNYRVYRRTLRDFLTSTC